MDLVGIFHVVDMLSSGKCDFSHIYVVGLIQFILIHFDTVLFDSVHLDSLSLWCSFNVHVLVWLLFQECQFVSSFSYCVLSQIQGVVWYSVDMCGFLSSIWFSWMTMVWIDHPVVVHTEKFYTEVYICNSKIFIYMFCSNLSTSTYDHNLNLSISSKEILIWGAWFKSPKITFINFPSWHYIWTIG